MHDFGKAEKSWEEDRQNVESRQICVLKDSALRSDAGNLGIIGMEKRTDSYHHIKLTMYCFFQKTEVWRD